MVDERADLEYRRRHDTNNVAAVVTDISDHLVGRSMIGVHLASSTGYFSNASSCIPMLQ